MRGCARNWDRRVGGCAYLSEICVKDWLLEGWEFTCFRQMGEWAGQDGNGRLWGFAHLWGGGVPQGEEVVVLPPLLHLHLPPRNLLCPSCSSSSSCFMQGGLSHFLFLSWIPDNLLFFASMRKGCHPEGNVWKLWTLFSFHFKAIFHPHMGEISQGVQSMEMMSYF